MKTLAATAFFVIVGSCDQDMPVQVTEEICMEYTHCFASDGSKVWRVK